MRYPDPALPWPLPYSDVQEIASEEKGPDLRNPGPALIAYLCPSKVWTIGYGETEPDGRKVVGGMRATFEQVDRWFCEDLTERVAAVRKLMTHPETNESHVAACVSFAYNVGLAAFAKSNVLKLHNAGRFNAVPGAMSQWKYGRVNGVLTEFPGLVARRLKEGARYMRTPVGAYEPPVPQGVAPEKPLAASPTVLTTAAAGAVGATDLVSKASEDVGWLEGVKPVVAGAKAWLADLTGLPPAWVLSALLVVALGYILYRRIRQRYNGVA